MKVIDYSEIQLADGKLSLADRVSGSFQHGFSWPKQVEAEYKVIDHLNKILGKDFTILHNFTLPEIDVPIPLILIGPPGITVIEVSSLSGIFRAKNDSWSVMNNRARQFKPVTPNLITRTLLMAQAVRKFIDEHEISDPNLEGVLVFTHPGTHVDAIRPAVRVILMDAIDRFANRLNQSDTIFSVEDVRKIVDVFDARHEEISILAEDSTLTGTMGGSTRHPNEAENTLDRLSRVFNFSRQQWTILFGMIAAELCIIVVLIMIIFLTA